MSNKITIDLNRLYTKSKFAEDFNMSRVTLDKKIKNNEIKTIKIQGGLKIVIKP